ncbi:MAG TPA: hypothetical protein VK874_06095 [Gaiellaceae bacterium]|nr:hypothetical protein [Gaiellaceae bacterium]
MDERARRVGLNEALFREVNERIRDVSESFVSAPQELSIVCECGHLDCAEQISIPVGEYERVRAQPTTFAVLPGHVIPDLEDVVETTDGYVVVRKREGAPAQLARELDR